MRRIINGKIYNTETAIKIASARSGGHGDFNHFEETLYLSPKGAVFLAGRGGPMSRYAERCLGGGLPAGRESTCSRMMRR